MLNVGVLVWFSEECAGELISTVGSVASTFAVTCLFWFVLESASVASLYSAYTVPPSFTARVEVCDVAALPRPLAQSPLQGAAALVLPNDPTYALANKLAALLVLYQHTLMLHT